MTLILRLIPLVLILLQQSHSDVIRDKKGDKFKFPCSKCKEYRSYCEQSYCKCEYGLTFFKNKNKKLDCVYNPSKIENCKILLRPGQTLKSFNLQSQKILGKISSADNDLNNCRVQTTLFWSSSEFEWKNLYDGKYRKSTDFTINNNGFEKLLVFNLSNQYKDQYNGLLIKLILSCETYSNCLMFKSTGKMKDSYFNKTITVSTRSSTQEKPQPDENDKKDNLIAWSVIGVASVLFVGFTILCIFRFKRNCKISSKQHKRKQKEMNTVSHKALLSAVSTIMDYDPELFKTEEFDSSVYVDPDAVLNEKEKQNNSPYDYPYLHNLRFQKKAKPSSISQTEGHEYADIEQQNIDHPYDDPESYPYCNIRNNPGYAMLNSDKPYVEKGKSDYQTLYRSKSECEIINQNINAKPCPDSRKSVGYAILDVGTLNVVQRSKSEYQLLELKNNCPRKENKKDCNSPTYFQLDFGNECDQIIRTSEVD